MLIAVLDDDGTRRTRLLGRLATLGYDAASFDGDTERSAGLVIVGCPTAEPAGALLARLSTDGAVVLVIADEISPALQAAAALCGAEILAESVSDAAFAGHLRTAARLWGEAARRRVMEAQRDQVLAERDALRILAPFERGGLILSPASGRYQAQLLLEHQAATIMMIAIDDLAALRAGAGIDAAQDAERATAALLVRSPARLGDMLHARGAELGWGLWCADTDRQAVAIQARQILDLVEARRLPHDFARGADSLTISIGIATAGFKTAAGTAEARALQALGRAASLGGNRIRWAD
jgi:GGDEF domain-containing protein